MRLGPVGWRIHPLTIPRAFRVHEKKGGLNPYGTGFELNLSAGVANSAEAHSEDSRTGDS